MKITNFEHTGLDKIELWIEKNNIKFLDEKSLKEALKTINISFVAEGIDRVQSMLLCEMKDSYVQQSQRYVAIKEDGYILPALSEEDNKLAKALTEKAFDLYKRMSELKDGDFKGRPKIENYKYGIPIEDARYILPLSTKTNVSVTMTGDKLCQLFCLMNDKKYLNIFSDFKKELCAYLPNNLIYLLPKACDSDKNKALIENLYDEDMKKIDTENNMVLLTAFNNLDLKVGLGALTSTQARTPSETLTAWGGEADSKAKGVAKRVLGYGHESIAEQARTTFGMMCSMVTYHQQIRHRLSENHREDLCNIILDPARPVLVPPSIKNSVFYQEYLDLVETFKDFRLYILKNYGQDKAFSFI